MVQHRDEATARSGRQYSKSVEFLDSRASVLRGLEDSRHERILYVSFPGVWARCNVYIIRLRRRAAS